MSFLFAQPEMLGAAATDLASIGSAISTANAGRHDACAGRRCR
ncbi:PE-PGRS family protein [Mycobacterium tuberculosis]|nr:PE-PGRS family protein [Mycobacterium tuberculosis]